MRQSRLLVPSLLLGIIFFLASGTKAHGSLYNSINKYRNNRISLSQLEKISRYDHFIRYFTGFSYFLPGNKISPDFIRALILAESGARHDAVSMDNALGLGQILYTTGKDAAAQLAQSKVHFRFVSKERLRNLREEDLFDPAINILLTVYLVAKYNYKFDGRLELVVSAWNAGENTESLSYGRHAPYQETENLIGKINGYYLYLLNHKLFP